jgi:hypothetical protein
MLNLSPEEREYLIDLLRAAHTDLLHEIHHSRTRRFGESLRQRVAINESLAARLSGDPEAGIPDYAFEKPA